MSRLMSLENSIISAFGHMFIYVFLSSIGTTSFPIGSLVILSTKYILYGTSYAKSKFTLLQNM